MQFYLFDCFFSGNAKVSEILIQNEADLNLKDDEGYTPLHKAVLNGIL